VQVREGVKKLKVAAVVKRRVMVLKVWGEAWLWLWWVGEGREKLEKVIAIRERETERWVEGVWWWSSERVS
jgi:hypothetical protein